MMQLAFEGGDVRNEARQALAMTQAHGSTG
jgi:hypothetical protein